MKKLYHLLMFLMLSTLLVACAASESGGKKEDKKTEEGREKSKKKTKKEDLKIKPIMMSLLIKLRKKQILKKSNLPKTEDHILLKVMLRLIKILIPLL